MDITTLTFREQILIKTSIVWFGVLHGRGSWVVHCVFRIKNKLNASSNAAATVKEPQTSAKTICRFYVAWRDNVAQCNDAAAPSGEKSSKLHSKFCRGPKACPLNALQPHTHYNGDWHVCDGLSLLFGRTSSFYQKSVPFHPPGIRHLIMY